MAQRLGISLPYLSEILTGKKTGLRKILDFAERLGVSVDWLAGDQNLIPLVAEVTAEEPFRFRENNYLELLDITQLPGITQKTAMHCYALRIRGDSMIPFYKDGDILIVERNCSGKIKHGDMVVWHKEEGSYIRSLDLADKTIKLRPLNLVRYKKSAQAASLTQVDKIIFKLSS